MALPECARGSGWMPGTLGGIEAGVGWWNRSQRKSDEAMARRALPLPLAGGAAAARGDAPGLAARVEEENEEKRGERKREERRIG